VKTPTSQRTWSLGCLLLAAVLAFTGCAAQEAFKHGNELIASGDDQAGLVALEEAARLDPDNIQYRIALTRQRTALIYGLTADADRALREDKLTEAEAIFRRMLVVEPSNAVALQGLEALTVERRHRARVAEAEALLARDPAGNATAALVALRDVLAENPHQKQAVNLRERIEDELSKKEPSVARLAAAYRKPITLEFRDAPLKSIFDAISKISGLNFFFDKDIRPDLRATVLAKDTSIEDTIKVLLVTNQLEQRVLGENAILIYPNTPAKLKDYQTLKVRTFYLANADVKGVSNTIKTLLKTQDLVVDERLGLIIMRDTAEAIGLAERLIALQDLSDPEVMLEVEILEIKRARLIELGVRLPPSATLTPLVAEGQTLTLAQLLDINKETTAVDIGGVTVNMRKEDQDANILANPRIRVRNKDPATVLIGDRVPVITTTSTSTGFVSESVNYVDVGLRLDVEPNIYLDGEVAIKIKLEVSNLVREVLSKSGTLAYQIGTRSANTTLRLRDGETQILAGLISDEDRVTANKFPGLGDLPVLGRLFGSKRNDRQRSEIVLSITPRIVRSLRRPDLMAAEFDSGTQSSLGASSLNFSSTASADNKAAAANGTAAGSAPLIDAPAAVPTAASASAPPPGVPAAAAAPAAVGVPANPPGNGSAAPAPAESAPVFNATPSTMPVVTDPLTAATPSAPVGALALSWNGPRQVRTGEQFSAVLRLSTESPVRSLPLMVSFDPRMFQVVRVDEGDFLRQSGGQTSFNQRVDAAQGRVFVSAVRLNTAGNDNGTNGAGSVVNLSFKAIASGSGTIRLQSLAPEPAYDVSRAVPLDLQLKVVP